MRKSVLVGFRKNSDIKYEDFQIKFLLGRGTFGKVFLAELIKSKKLYAIKAIRKDILIEYSTTRLKTLSSKRTFFSAVTTRF